ncbi:MAG: diguanylate cyclase/phosphodiesterase, partial [Frankiales bacterium]|nr:diguanylate cyclase/phosphodiesterase [Frankiales bacterium]
MVLVYIVLLLLATAAVGDRLPVGTLSHDDIYLLPALPLLVAAAEFFQVRFRIGAQVDGSNLIEAAIAPVIVIAPSFYGVVVVAAGLVIAALVRRNSPVKALFNMAQWSLATAVGAWVWTSFDLSPDTPQGAGAVLLSVLVLGLVNLAAFTGVMLLQGADLRALRPIIGIGWFASLSVNSLLGLLFVLADETTPYALILAPVPLVVLHLAYQGYAAARLDRARLVGIHAAAQVLSDPLNPRKAIVPFLRAAAEVFETTCATLVLKQEHGWKIHRLERSTGEVDVRDEVEGASSLELAMTAQLGPIRLRESDKGPLAAALREAGHRDCLAAPLHDGGRVIGALMLIDQAGMEGAPEGQLAVLEALAREAAAAFTRGWLLDSVFEERRNLATVVGA